MEKHCRVNADQTKRKCVTETDIASRWPKTSVNASHLATSVDIVASARIIRLTSSYMNCKVSADLPTPPLPTMITLCTGDWSEGNGTGTDDWTGWTVDDFDGASPLLNTL